MRTDIIKNTWDLVDEVRAKTRGILVSGIDEEQMQEPVEQLQAFCKAKKDKSQDIGDMDVSERELLIKQCAVYNLVADSINFCYWYGSDEVRPGGCSCGKMYDLLNEALAENGDAFSSQVIDRFGQLMTSELFPLSRERVIHLNELSRRCYTSDQKPTTEVEMFCGILAYDLARDPFAIDPRDWLEGLVHTFPISYGQDPLMKRAFLFFLSLYRELGLFRDTIAIVPPPIDYHIPNVLSSWFKVFSYLPELRHKIDRREHLPAGSMEEVALRCHSMFACRVLAERTGCTMSDVDNFLFSMRKEVQKHHPFHLTVTTNY